MPELLLEIEDRMDTGKSLFLQFHRGNDMLEKVKSGFQSEILQGRIDILTSSVITNVVVGKNWTS
ncbi:MAG: hypothetical protein GC193_14460 [Cryomorphaceae bacterium]|nr:hypothetical protein [Cryomorphaceae bacterium]